MSKLRPTIGAALARYRKVHIGLLRGQCGPILAEILTQLFVLVPGVRLVSVLRFQIRTLTQIEANSGITTQFRTV